jgi:hypothetical protein
MATKDRRAEEREALVRLLDVCGADRTRWPARERLRFASFIAEDDDAKRLLKEAAALDDLLDRAPRVSEDRERALQERIVAAALRSVEPKLEVIVGKGGESGLAPARSRWSTPSFAKSSARGEWPAAALLAASLVVGVILGTNGTLDPAVQEVAEVTGLSTGTVDGSRVALGEEMVAFADEDLL